MSADGTVAPGVRRLAIPLPLALRVVNAYLLEGTADRALVDAGLHTEEAELMLRGGLRDAGADLSELRRVFVTHVHPDHIGMAGLLETAGAEVVMHRPEAEHARRLWSADQRLVGEAHAWFADHGMPADVDDEMRAAWLWLAGLVHLPERITTAADGDVVDLGGRALRVVWTPGHTDFHAALVDERDGLLFAGDHVLPRITSNVSLYPWSRDDPLGDFLGALRMVASLPVRRVLPAHGEPFDDLPGRVDELLDHHQHRLAAVLDALGGREHDAYAVCRALFPRLRSAHEERFALAETLAHLRHLDRRGSVEEIASRPIRWRARRA